MSEEEKTSTPSKPAAVPALNSPRAESPTTARPLDFDDEPQESGVTTVNNPPSQQTATETLPAAPPKPPRPMSPKQHAENTLKEAFPTIEANVVRAVLTASNWNVERAFNALLGMTDPTAQEDMAPPPKPPRPTATSTGRSQLEADEQYARQLADHYNSGRRRQDPGWQNDPRYHQPRGSEDSEEKEYSFFDDDLPVIRDNLRKGFLETQSKVNSWVTSFKKRLDGDDLDEEPSQSREQPAPYGRPRRSGDMARRSGDRERYDADPQLFGDDFSALELRDSDAPPPRPPRPVGNPNLKKTSSPSPDRRKVSFQDGPPAEIDTGRNTQSGSKSSKWQPLATVDPSPVAENDPFSLGDSDDEKETKPKEQTTVPESEQLKQATAEAMSGEMDSKDKNSKTEESK
ncbi:Ubiquitin system component Cue [Penicillium odoratum]|uniref:Ubiquitin system component Cue n=1 Tax=Penicillium odoratum TaxID=1167516 RepID=UPI0025472631|nr:Ubiquitin system component Cue [Penicillium odoratum]KAJ5777189.1 Ubiquitin system component Cue [Penicillium odoratum]